MTEANESRVENALEPATEALQVRAKNPLLAAFFALFPGAGHIYNGLYMRGVAFFLIIASLIGLAMRSGGLFGFAIAFFWIFNVLDSYRQAALINIGLVQDYGLVDVASAPKPGQSGIVAGILMFAIGLFAVIDRYWYIDLDWIVDLWPLALMAVGGWVVWSSLRDKKKAAAEEEDALY